MNTNRINQILVILVETIDQEGIPEGYLHAGLDSGGYTPAEIRIAVEIALTGGILRRENGPKLVPGPGFTDLREKIRLHKVAS